MRRVALILALIPALAVALCACSGRAQDESGVVARVNGSPITLEMLEFQYDQLHFEALGGAMPTVSSLREAYGDILGQLIARELVAQELQKRGQEVSREEIAKAEAEIRGDYGREGGGEAFEQMLAEEYIDLRQWRRQLSAQLGVEKFQRLVLRPAIRLDHREVEAYYREHLDDFRLPERLRLLVARGPDRQGVEKALELYRLRPDAAALAAALPEVQAREIVLARGLVSPAWADALHGEAGKAGAILPVGHGRGGFEGVLLLERLPAQTRDIAEAYQQVEAALLERRMQDAFEAWLAKAVDAAVIRVSGRLLHQTPDEDLPPDPGEDKAQQDIASGNETG